MHRMRRCNESDVNYATSNTGRDEDGVVHAVVAWSFESGRETYMLRIVARCGSRFVVVHFKPENDPVTCIACYGTEVNT